MRYLMALTAVAVAAVAIWLSVAAGGGARSSTRAGAQLAVAGTATPFEPTPGPPNAAWMTREGLIVAAKGLASTDGGTDLTLDGFEHTTVRGLASTRRWTPEDADRLKRTADLTDGTAVYVVRLRGTFKEPTRPGRPESRPERLLMTVVFDGRTGRPLYIERLPVGR